MLLANLPQPFMIVLATTPLLVVLYLMVGRQWGGSKAGPAGLLTAILAGILFFGATGQLIVIALTKAIFLSLFVLYIIWMALLLYHTVNDAGAIAAIGQELPRLAQGRAAQALLLSWVFGSFLQGATGFGVPAAVVAPLLVGVGFAASPAVVMALLGHAWAVTFGSLGSSFISLIAATGVSGEVLATPVSALLGVLALGCGLAVLWIVDRRAAVRRRGLLVLGLTIVMGGTQWLVAQAGLYSLASLAAGLAGLVVAIPLLSHETQRSAAVESASLEAGRKRLATAFIPYAILIAVVVAGQLLLGGLLNQVVVDPVYPEVCTTTGYCTPAGNSRSISVFGHGGALLLYATLIIFAWYRWRGALPTAAAADYSGKAILSKTVRGSIRPTIGIYSLVAMAVIMEHAGMTNLLATMLSRSGPLFPLLSPFIGALGAFMTGSNTNSNVVFGQLQKQTAMALGLAVPLILAAQTAGAAIGSAFAPAKVIVGSSTVPGAKEGDVLHSVTKAGLILIAALGAITLLATTFGP